MTPDVEERVIDWIARGGSLRSFCRRAGNPAQATVYAWCAVRPEFGARFARARKQGLGVVVELLPKGSTATAAHTAPGAEP